MQWHRTPCFFRFLHPLDFQAFNFYSFDFRAFNFCGSIFRVLHFSIIRAPLIFAHSDAIRAPLIFAHPKKSQNFRFWLKMCYLALWNEFGEIAKENKPIYILEVRSEGRYVSHRNKRTYLTLESFKVK